MDEYDEYQDEYFYIDESNYIERDVCVNCGRIADDNCGFCGNPLCFMCYETGAGFCGKYHTQEQIDEYARQLMGEE